jgi:propionyl-CoA carboxylase beta chain
VTTSEEDALVFARILLSYLPQNNQDITSLRTGTQDSPARKDEALNSLVPEDSQKPYEIKRAITSIVDNNSFLELQSSFAKNIIVGFARLNGTSVGIVANNPMHLAGTLDINASVKAARFVQFCDAFGIPILTFVDVPGFLPGVSQEHAGIIRHGAKLLFAYAQATVPKLTVITRKAYGGAYDVMSSKHIGANFNVAWPTAELAVMGPEGACNIIFKKEITGAKQPEKKRKELVAYYKEHFASPYIAASRGYVDDVIEPASTREFLIRAMQDILTKRKEMPQKKHGNIPL